MSKVAFVTMDMESFFDSGCMKRHHIDPDETFDCASEVERFINFLDKNNVKATMFVAVSFLSRCKETLLKAIKNGHEIALHCLEHKDVRTMSVEQFETELIEAKEAIKKELGVEPVGFRFPCFKYTNEYIEVVKRNGFIYDSSATTKKLRNKITIDEGFYEFSPNIYQFLLFFRINLSGGGYLRLMPRWLYSNQLNRCIKNGYYQLYLHPFEIYEGKFPKYRSFNIFEKMYINRGRNKYLSLISRLIDKLKKDGYEFLTMENYILRETNHE